MLGVGDYILYTLNNFIYMSTTMFQETNRSCLNNSSSKQLYSFSKGERFPNYKELLTSRIDFLGSSYSENKIRSGSFTKSKRELVFENEEQFKSHPSPGEYNWMQKQKNNGVSLGIRLRPFNSPRSNATSPGPGSYQAKSVHKSNSGIFTKQIRQLKYPEINRKGLDTPGPILIQTQKLKSILSNFKGIKQTKIHKKIQNNRLQMLKLKLKAHQERMKQKLEKKLPKMKVSKVENLSNSIIFKKQKMTVFDKQIRKSYFDVHNLTPSPTDHNNNFSEFSQRNKPDSKKISLKLSRFERGRQQNDIKKRYQTLPTKISK